MKWIHRFFSSHEPSFFYKFSDATPRWEIGSRKHRPKGISENRWADQEKTLFRRPSFQVSVALLLILFTLQLQQPFFSSIARLPSSLQFQPSVVRCFFHERNIEKFFFFILVLLFTDCSFSYQNRFLKGFFHRGGGRFSKTKTRTGGRGGGGVLWGRQQNPSQTRPIDIPNEWKNIKLLVLFSWVEEHQTSLFLFVRRPSWIRENCNARIDDNPCL